MNRFICLVMKKSACVPQGLESFCNYYKYVLNLKKMCGSMAIIIPQLMQYWILLVFCSFQKTDLEEKKILSIYANIIKFG